MDYYIKGRLEIRDDKDLLNFINMQKGIQSMALRTGTLQRHKYADKPDIFAFEARSRNPVVARKLFDEFSLLMESGDIPGWIGWHECRHEEEEGGCVYNELFQWPLLEVE